MERKYYTVMATYAKGRGKTETIKVTEHTGFIKDIATEQEWWVNAARGLSGNRLVKLSLHETVCNDDIETMKLLPAHTIYIG